MLQYAKAITAALIAGLTSLQVALDDGITSQEWVGVGIGTLVALAAVWAVPNRAPA